MSLTAGLYYGIFRLKFHGDSFTVHPGQKRYRIEDIASWKVYEDTEAQPGFQRHLELRFDRWYRRYLLLEEDVPPTVFDALLKSLREQRGTGELRPNHKTERPASKNPPLPAE